MKCYDSGKENKYIMYLDASNLHGYAMSQYLRYRGFKLLSQREIDRFDVNPIGENSSIEYILEVDLEYSHDLHEIDNDYPLAPEKL